jgi:DNA polymerase-3 subunit alpha
MSGFCHLHVHTEFSLLDGAARVKDLVARAKALDMDALAITDHGVMYGVVDFYKEAVENGIKPIIGCEVYAVNDMEEKTYAAKEYAHLILLAKNNTGYKNLVWLVSEAFTRGFYYKPRIDYKLLKEHAEGIICLSACLAGDIPQCIMKNDIEGAKRLIYDLKETFGEDFYLELQDNGIPEEIKVNDALIALSKECGVPLVATNDVHYVNREDAEAQDVLLCIQTARYIDEEDRMKFETDEFYLRSEAEMKEKFAHVPEALSNTARIAQQCEVTFDFSSIHLPAFDVPGGQPHAAYLKELCEEGLIKRYGNPSEDLHSRLDYELSVIDNMGFTDYFLIVWDFVHFSKQNGITVGPGRGSAAGSLAAYVLEITDVDPIEYNLLFERFLNPERISMPDIDIDFCIERRQEVIDYVVRKYGSDRVAQIITFGTLGAKQVLRDVARTLRVPPAESDRIAKMVPFALKMTIDRALEESPKLRQEYEENETVRKIIDTARKLEGLPRHASVHAAGVVISSLPVTEYVPLQVNPKDGSVITQFPMNTLEMLGLLKMDFLGLRNLTVVRHTTEMLEEERDIKLDLASLKYDDPEVYKLIASGDTDGVFQLESAGMRQLAVQMKAENLNDIMVVISLYRPGPMDSIPAYLEARRNPKRVKYAHPLLEPILRDTYGCIVYQEQVMEIVRTLAGYSLGRSDLVRRAMAKKKAKVMEQERKIFVYGEEKDGKVTVDGAVRRGVPAPVAEKIFDQMMDFAQYAFNKSHACAYAAIAYYTAYLKRYYRLEFLTSLINSFLNFPEKMAAYVQYLRKLGIAVLPPDVNISKVKFSVEGEGIRFGLAAIRDVGEKAVTEIIAERKKGAYKNFMDFLRRNADAINKKSLEGLILSGGFDSMGVKRSQLMGICEKSLAGVYEEKKRNASGQVSLFDECFDMGPSCQAELPDIPEYKERHKLSLEKKAAGVYLSGHPLDEYKEIMDAMEVNTFRIAAAKEDEVERGYFDGKSVELLGILTFVRKRSTRLKKLMANAVLEDLYGSVELIVFPSVLSLYEDHLVEDSIVTVRGKVDIQENDEPQIIVDSVAPYVKKDKMFEGKKLYVKIPQELEDGWARFTQIIRAQPGSDPVVVMLERTGKVFTTNGGNSVTYTKTLLEKLNQAFGDANVVLK